jgi:phosphodiesterase/alkaline phosphatase D-like protein
MRWLLKAVPMNRLLLARAFIAGASALLYSNLTLAQPVTQLPPADKAGHVEILQGPALEFAREDLAIIRWTINNPGGPDDHFAVAHYGTDPKNLSCTAKSHIRLNRDHLETILRVRIEGLKPLTTYYYRVASAQREDVNDAEKSPIEKFSTPGPGQRIIAFPQPE